MHSPLAWVMNTGFFLFGITVLAAPSPASSALVREFAATVAQVTDDPMVRLRTLGGGPDPF
jgi:hypothetical protein